LTGKIEASKEIKLNSRIAKNGNDKEDSLPEKEQQKGNL